ncbi:hypothetical protein [Longirhabdus pacifica]|uniref:hypothetical protein n=1 Tax=Longirhabdus pacifica TaxID=2305227 RepID=UPI0013E8C7C3|nr:hypothetical protein [Longirhabdus pacifica]
MNSKTKKIMHKKKEESNNRKLALIGATFGLLAAIIGIVLAIRAIQTGEDLDLIVI